MIAAKLELERHKEAQAKRARGGRPKGVKVRNEMDLARPGKPRIFAQRCEPGDELIVALGHFQGVA